MLFLVLNKLPLFVQTVRNLQIRRNLPLVHGIALEHVVFKDVICPLAKTRASNRFNAIADRDDYVKVVQDDLRNLHFPFNCAMGSGMCKICTYHF